MTRVASLLVLTALVALPAGAQERRPLKVDDIFELKAVGDPQISPDGAWVAYTVSERDAKKDETNTSIYMVAIGGGEPIRLTASDKPERRPRWSPDGRYLAFLSAREEKKKTQVWLLDRRGGEATRLTDFKSGVSAFEWSPDSTRLALVVQDPDPEDTGEDDKEKSPKPIVVTRLQFKQDGVGFLDDRREHIYVFDIAKRTSVQITTGPYDNSSPAWSPDGRWLAFVSNRTQDPDSNHNTDIFVVSAAGGEPRAVAASEATEDSPHFTADGKLIVYSLGGDPKDMWYGMTGLAAVPASGGEPRVLTPGMDRNAFWLRGSADGRYAVFVLEDGGNMHLARVPVAGGAIERVVAGERDVNGFALGPKGEIVVLESTWDRPDELSRVDAGGALTRLTRTNDEFLARISLGRVERFTAKSGDGTAVDGFLVRPPTAPEGRKLPTILRIHGGPVSQYTSAFDLEWQMLAAQGYAVVGANPRGSSGHGRDFAHAIWADWGNKDTQDVLAAVDHVVAMGVADPDRLGVGGWSYGGILTNYVITQTTRFKGAVSGSSEVNYLANYGHDHYQREWEMELGLPWETTDLWLRLSPFFKVTRITTPTLVVCGQEDWNVPLINSEQLYQALRRLGVPTELVIYPGESHGIRRPSFQKDRLERYIAWYDRWVKGDGARKTQ